MDAERNHQITELRQKGFSCNEIADALSISVNTVKSYCRRHELQRQNPTRHHAIRPCLQCGKGIPQTPHRKTKNSAVIPAA